MKFNNKTIRKAVKEWLDNVELSPTLKRTSQTR